MNIDWADVAWMSLIGGFAPSGMKALKNSLYSSKAAINLNKQLKNIKAPSRIEKVTTRRDECIKNIGNHIKTQTWVGGIKIISKKINDKEFTGEEND